MKFIRNLPNARYKSSIANIFYCVSSNDRRKNNKKRIKSKEEGRISNIGLLKSIKDATGLEFASFPSQAFFFLAPMQHYGKVMIVPSRQPSRCICIYIFTTTYDTLS